MPDILIVPNEPPELERLQLRKARLVNDVLNILRWLFGIFLTLCVLSIFRCH